MASDRTDVAALMHAQLSNPKPSPSQLSKILDAFKEVPKSHLFVRSSPRSVILDLLSPAPSLSSSETTLPAPSNILSIPSVPRVEQQPNLLYGKHENQSVTSRFGSGSAGWLDHEGSSSQTDGASIRQRSDHNVANSNNDQNISSVANVDNEIRRQLAEKILQINELKQEVEDLRNKSSADHSKFDVAVRNIQNRLDEKDRQIISLRRERQNEEREKNRALQEKANMERNFLLRVREQQDLLDGANQQRQQQVYEPPPPPPPPATNPYSNQNPFQAASNVDEKESNNNPSKQYQKDRQPQHRNLYNQQAPSAPQPAIQKNVPESLKRKFVPPTRKQLSATGNVGDNPSKQQKRQPVAAKAGGGGLWCGNDEEYELPEELEHLDAELVKQIQFDILKPDGKITFSTISGLKAAKERLNEMIIMPLVRPELFRGLTSPPKGLLLFGPPGTGKTLIGKAIANESKSCFFSISSSSLTSKWIGQGEKMVKTLFAVAAYNSPAIVFIDEVDSILTKRSEGENEASRRMKTEILVQLDGAKEGGNVLIIGATNRPGELDDAARRRFVAKIYIPLPESEGRIEMITKLLSTEGTRHDITPASIKKLAEKTDGFSGADMKSLCNDASMGPIRSLGSAALTVDPGDVRPIQYTDFKKSLKTVKASVAQDDLEMFEEFDRQFAGLGRKASQVDGDDEDDDTEDDEGSEINAKATQAM